MNALAEHFDACDGIAEKAKNAQIQLDALTLELDHTIKKLKAVKVELAQAEEALQKKHHIINDEKAIAFREIDDQIKAKLEELKKTEIRTKEARAQFDNVIAGMAALQQRLRV